MKYLIIALLGILVVWAITAFKNRKGGLPIVRADLLEVGQLLFPAHKGEFKAFFSSFLADRTKFLSENEELLEEYGSVELEELAAIDVLYFYGESRGLLWTTDWRGEEDEGEIEAFVERLLQGKVDWAHVTTQRQRVRQEDQRDGVFILELFAAIDKDLEPLNKKLVFLDRGGDSYVYTVIDRASVKIITDEHGAPFHGTEKFRK